MKKSKNREGAICSELSDAIGVWNRAAISLMDIRHNLITREDPLREFRFPASAFIFTSGAGAEVVMNETSYRAERFGLFHGGRGTELTILPSSGWHEYYMVLYRAGEPFFHKREYAKLLEKVNPFQQQYGFATENPLFFSHQMRLMYEKWKDSTSLRAYP